MPRRLLAFPAITALALVGVGTAGPAGAEPNPEPPSCSYTLSPPQLAQVAGSNMATATMAMAACTGSAVPASTVACIQPQNSDSAGQCFEGEGLIPAQVYFAPYRPGTIYVSRGRGCANVPAPPSSICESAGPNTATL